jgi:hypothetical protein
VHILRAGFERSGLGITPQSSIGPALLRGRVGDVVANLLAS